LKKRSVGPYARGVRLYECSGGRVSVEGAVCCERGGLAGINFVFVSIVVEAVKRLSTDKRGGRQFVVADLKGVDAGDTAADVQRFAVSVDLQLARVFFFKQGNFLFYRIIPGRQAVEL